MATTPNNTLPLIDEGQANAEANYNEAIVILDAVVRQYAKDFDPSPVANPQNGDLYIVSTSPSGAFSGKANHLAIYFDGWRFIPPKEGMRFYVDDLSDYYFYTGSAWSSGGQIAALTGGISAGYVQAEVLGIYNKVNALIAALQAIKITKP